MYNAYGLNLRKCISTSSLSGCIERDFSKVIIALPTSNTVAEIFEKELLGVLVVLIQKHSISI